MKESKLSRRKVLSAIAAAGSTGAVLGSGTAAKFHDTEELTTNTLAAGVVDMAVTWETDNGDSGSSLGGTALPITITDETVNGNPDVVVDLTVSLPGAENNPVYPWLQLSCPEQSRLAGDLHVTLSYRGGDEIESGSLFEVASELRSGIPLSPNGTNLDANQRDCLESDGTVDLVLTVDLPETYAGRESLSLEFHVHATQCRHNDGTTSPYPDFDGKCPEPPTDSDKKGISFIGFCSSNNPEPELVSVNSTTDTGQPVSVDWETGTDVRAVVIKAGRYLTIYDYSDEMATSGTATPNDNDAAAYISTDDDAYKKGDESTPCTVAQRVIDGNTDATFDGTQVKFEYEGKT